MAVAVVAWFGLSYFSTNLILSIERRHPQLVGTRILRAAEVTICGSVVLTCFAFAIWLASLIWLAGK
ncbi:MAG: hypothetical protein DMF61_08405 [Blastocatellia bacterium AA13]|nr:MAG: hypothetical protein DMF61_08405 [Blastocatellia bacterium AA13]